MPNKKIRDNIRIKVAVSATDYKGIREIWDEQFPADAEYQENVFATILPLCKTYIIHETDSSGNEGKILSTASLMPMKFIDSCPKPVSTTNIRKIKGLYMFGVATRNGFEGKGYASRLINHAISELERNNYNFIFERPANQNLIDFYLKFGFTKILKKKECRFNAISGEPSNSGESDNYKINNASECILKVLRTFPKRFEWESSELLENLIKLGEIERHHELLTPESLQEECYIAVKPLNDTPESAFDDAFFCFPLE
jgi:GNAT superfamily N-acetyltransferase